MQNPYFKIFETDISNLSLPEKFTYPFSYTPNELAIKASEGLQSYLESNPQYFKDIGSLGIQSENNVGKMFGVLVVQSSKNELGYLCGFSGKLSDHSTDPIFVPPVVDLLAKGGIFKKEENEIIAINDQLKAIDDSNELTNLEDHLKDSKLKFEQELLKKKEEIKLFKEQRAIERNKLKDLSDLKEIEAQTIKLNKQSQSEKTILAEFKKSQNLDIKNLETDVLELKDKIKELKKVRKQKSSALQKRIFNQFEFLNFEKESKKLADCFIDETNITPPSGSGDCAAPKLLEFAYRNNFKPIALAEFWWGESPKSEIRKHKSYYPACKSKCYPILQHMLKGLEVDSNPLLEVKPLDIEIVFEDEHILLINKPTGLLSAPGKIIDDSVYTRLKNANPQFTGPIVVHRLDMATSGLIVCAKELDIYKKLQAQFMKRTVQKRYVALLDGVLSENLGIIDLPLIVDWENRPNQKVCYDTGKPAKTKWKTVEVINNKTRVHFYPITGRTHQLRVHAAHHQGLNTPIVGDKFYGEVKDRLHLHAEQITFRHPVTNEEMSFEAKANF